MGTGELLGKQTNCGGVTCDGLASRPVGVELLLAASCYNTRCLTCIVTCFDDREIKKKFVAKVPITPQIFRLLKFSY